MQVKIKNVSFLKSVPNYRERPKPPQPSFVMLGRSNVGKSSLINALLHRKQIAKISSKPGKTKLINYFLVNQSWYLVDLPGYGWAQVSLATKKKWEKMTQDYLLYTPEIITAFLLIDSRHLPQKNDLAFVQWLGEQKIPFSLVFTKADLPKKYQLQQHIQAFQNAMQPYWEELPPFFITSSKSKKGINELLGYINRWLPTN